jgi:CBS domain-containing protein
MSLSHFDTPPHRSQPVCNEEGDVVGLLDITKVFHSSLEKLERAYGSSAQLYSALEGVQSEWSGANAALVAYVQQIRESMAAPDIGSLLDARTAAVTVNVRSSVRDAAKLMREHHTTAVIVMDAAAPGEESTKIAGIFTSKDVVLRVIAAGLDSRTCSVVRVMTPHPDTAFPDTTIQAALRKMNGQSSALRLRCLLTAANRRSLS